MKANLLSHAFLALVGVAAASAAMAADKVRVGLTMSTADAPVFLANARGDFAKNGLDVEVIPFDSASKTVAPLATGDLDVAGGSASAGFFNAAARKIEIRIVANRAAAMPGFHYQSVIVRKDLLESGTFKSYHDMKGMKVGIPAPGTGGQILIDEMARMGGLKYSDVEQVYLSFPQLVIALQNKAVDVALMIEPYAGAAISNGAGREFQRTEEFYPRQEVSLLFYGDKFARERAEVAKRFMIGWLLGARAYNDAIRNGEWTNDEHGKFVTDTIAKAIGMKPEQIRSAPPQFTNPDGFVNMNSIEKDLAFYRAQGLVAPGPMAATEFVDLTFVRQALDVIGPYKKP